MTSHDPWFALFLFQVHLSEESLRHLLTSHKEPASARACAAPSANSPAIEKSSSSVLEPSTISACLTYVYLPSSLEDAWQFITSPTVEVEDDIGAMEGITELGGIQDLKELRELPRSLQRLTFQETFDQRLDGVILPASLKSLTFGVDFNQSLDRVNLPNSLQSLTFDRFFNQSLDEVTLPSNLLSLTFGVEFNQSLKRVSLPSTLRSLTFGVQFNQSMDGVTLPSSLQQLTFGDSFNQPLHSVTLPAGLHSLKFSKAFKESSSLGS